MYYPFLTAIVTLVSLIMYFVFVARVAMMRGHHNVSGTVTTLPDDIAIAQRIQINTTEQLVLFLPLLWMAASLTTDGYAAIVGTVWVIGRLIYAFGYSKAFEKRTPGILINVIAYLFLTIGIVWGLIQYQTLTGAVTTPPAGM